MLRLAFRRAIDEAHVRIGNKRLLEILVQRGAAFLIAAFDFDRHLRNLLPVPLNLLALMDQRFVLLRIDLDFKVMSWGLRPGTRDNLHRFARRQLARHPCR